MLERIQNWGVLKRRIGCALYKEPCIYNRQ